MKKLLLIGTTLLLTGCGGACVSMEHRAMNEYHLCMKKADTRTSGSIHNRVIPELADKCLENYEKQMEVIKNSRVAK